MSRSEMNHENGYFVVGTEILENVGMSETTVAVGESECVCQ